MTSTHLDIHPQLTKDTAAWLGQRASTMRTGFTDMQATIELGLWRDALAIELSRIRLTLGQARCLTDVLNGHLMAPGLGFKVGLVYADCRDAFGSAGGYPPGYFGTKWGIDEQALLTYLGTQSPAADHALLDAITRWWDLGVDASVEGFAQVGLTVVPNPSQ
ncbi:hypothetical protein AB0F17_62335 [Nonomuraea sp. NPDC026600]|uniref:hypothetical protein n=1 Tax=Nonomuraea sp. NPDC026600 TaxID=3155363 RepID=UPI0033BFC8F1